MSIIIIIKEGRREGKKASYLIQGTAQAQQNHRTHKSRIRKWKKKKKRERENARRPHTSRINCRKCPTKGIAGKVGVRVFGYSSPLCACGMMKALYDNSVSCAHPIRRHRRRSSSMSDSGWTEVSFMTAIDREVVTWRPRVPCLLTQRNTATTATVSLIMIPILSGHPEVPTQPWYHHTLPYS